MNYQTKKHSDIPAITIDLILILILSLCACQPPANLPSLAPTVTSSIARPEASVPPTPLAPAVSPPFPTATLPDRAGARTLLTYDDLMYGSSAAPVDETAFALPAGAVLPAHYFEGRLELLGEADNGGFEKVHELYGYSAARQRQHLPEFDYEFVQDGSYLIPVKQGLLITGHPYWNIILGPGRAWQEASDQGYSRFSFPFTLVERNANCTHNGVMTFLFNGERVSNVRYQITQETCLYFKFNMWGQLAASYTPETIADAAAIKAKHAAELSDRLPVRPFSALATDFPDSGVDLDRFTNGITRQHLTTYGLVINGVNYIAGCETRYGPYAYCESMRLPSYSTAKSAFASLALMHLAQKYGSGVPKLLIKDYVPEYASSTGDWSTVTFGNALDMATGNYREPSYMADEGSSYMNAFFDVESYASRINAAFNFPHLSVPEKVWVYHTSDTFILTRAMNNYLLQQPGSQADIFDLVRDEVYIPLHLSAGALTSMRTDNSSTGSPLGGYGLFWTQDDIAKIGLLLNNQDGKIQGAHVLDPVMLADAMQKNPGGGGLDTSGSPVYKYKSGFWAKKWDSSDSPGYSCTFWTPFMSGYGGITIVLMPNGSLYYYFSDNDEFSWYDAVNESAKLIPMCP